jgi:TRAP-type C4-dicarboxylate transport system permease large subunit
MNRPLGVVLLVAGVALLVMGINSTNSIGSDFSRFFTGAPTDKAVWLLLGGVASLIVGSFMSLRGQPR